MTGSTGSPLRRVAGIAGLALVAGLVPVVLASPALAVQLAQDRLVSATPVSWTPNVLGSGSQVEAVVQVGNLTVVAGTFNQVQPAGSTATVTRNNIVGFNATTGVLSTTFVPTTNGEVTSLVVAADGQSIYAGGSFTTVNGAASARIAQLSVANGALVPAFHPPALSSGVRDLKLSAGRLWVAGSWTTIGGVAQRALATLDPTSGAVTQFMRVPIAGVHNGGGTEVIKMDISPDGSRLVGIGNFTTVGGTAHEQAFMLDLTGTSAVVANWQTNFYTTQCASVFNTYMRDLDISPDGTYFVISVTGAYGGSTGACDETSRWDFASTGSDLHSTWTDYTGGDTTYAVAITGTAVYVGGHMRWENNPYAGDAAGPGSVSRPGIAALDPVNGLPFAWNPTRDRGVGVFDMLATAQGMWVVSDTDHIAGAYHAKVAFFPLAGGEVIPTPAAGALPDDVYLAGRPGSATGSNVLARVDAGGPTLQATDGGPDWTGDSSDAPDSHHGDGSNTADYGTAVGSVTPSVSATAPLGLFTNERWAAQDWSFPVAAGTNVQVNLFFANRCSCTNTVGARVFNVSIDGVSKLANYDIVADVGDNRGVEKSFAVTSDGSVDIDFGQVTENPLINGIEIVSLDGNVIPPSASTPDALSVRHYDGTTVGVTTAVPSSIAWGQARGSVMLNGTLYTPWSDGNLYARSFDGTNFGAAIVVRAQDLIVPLNDWHSDVQNMTSLFYDGGRLYYTELGQTQLFYRYFTPEDGVVGALRFAAAGNVSGLDWSAVSGAFLSGTSLFVATAGDGNLHRIDWSAGSVVDGTAAVVSGPGVDGNDWTTRTMFLVSGTVAPPNQPPTASFTSSCVGLTCSFNAATSHDPDGTVVSYAWDFGDTGTGVGVAPSHTFTAGSTYAVKLTVKDDGGLTGAFSAQVTVAPQTGGSVAFRAAAPAFNNNARAASVTVPASVQAGDELLLYVNAANSALTLTGPSGAVTGWTQLGTRTIGTQIVWVYAKSAVAADAGRPVTFAASGMEKLAVELLAYSGAGAGLPSATFATDPAATVSHPTAAVPVAAGGSWVVSYWADRSSTTTGWTAAGGQVQRDQSLGSGGGRVTSLLTDGGGPVPTGTFPSQVAQTNAGSRAVEVSVVLAPA